MGLLLLVCLLLVLPSAAVWTQDPMHVIEREFDPLLGAFDHTRLAERIDVVRWGRWSHFIGFSVIGVLFYKLYTLVRDRPEAVSHRALAGFACLMMVTFFVGVPWVSADVFYYIGVGWMDGHHHLSPYLVAMDAAPDSQTEPMFQNVFAGFRSVTTPYGPLFQGIASRIAVCRPETRSARCCCSSW